VIHDFYAPEKTAFNRALEAHINKILGALRECRPFPSGMDNAIKFLQIKV